jgi:transposase-like protein
LDVKQAPKQKISAAIFKKVLGNFHIVDPPVINVDKSQTFPHSLSELQAANNMPGKKLRAIKYLNNSIETTINSLNKSGVIDNGTCHLPLLERLSIKWKLCE